MQPSWFGLLMASITLFRMILNIPQLRYIILFRLNLILTPVTIQQRSTLIMKKFFISLSVAAVAALALAICSKDHNRNTGPAYDVPATYNLKNADFADA